MKRHLILLLMLSMILSSCTLSKDLIRASKADPKGNNDALEVSKEQDRSPNLISNCSKEQINSLVKKGNYQKALKTIQTGLKNGKTELYYGAVYVNAINGVLKEGNDFYSSGDYASAGPAFRAALDNYPSVESLRAGINYPPGEIEKHLKGCSQKLMEEGLLSYRQGQLDSAISTWRMIEKFDPENEEAKKALHTATTQREQLKNIK